MLECLKSLKKKVGKLLEIGFVREVQYSDWITNVVMVKKANGKWQLCVDFINLNKAYLKDSYPLP